jgi:hypothetical protein
MVALRTVPLVVAVALVGLAVMEETVALPLLVSEATLFIQASVAQVWLMQVAVVGAARQVASVAGQVLLYPAVLVVPVALLAGLP